MKNAIHQLNGKEKNALHCMKKMIVVRLHPLIIYCFGYKTVVTTRNTAFLKRQHQEERMFTCELLIITQHNCSLQQDIHLEIQELIAPLGRVNMVIQPLALVLEKMKEGNLFFNWVHKNGMLLYNYNNSVRLLPDPVRGEYRLQAASYYTKDKGMNDYLEVNLT